MKHQKSKTEKAELADREKPKGSELKNATSAKNAKKVNINVNLTKKHPHPDALDKWNDRLDRNLESEKEGNTLADENARDYSEKHGSGDQSDEN